MQKMCTICIRIMDASFSGSHTETDCPLRASMYCSICARYGHLQEKCPAASHYHPYILYIKQSDNAIRAFLKEKGISYGTKLHNALYDYADLNGLRVIYIL